MGGGGADLRQDLPGQAQGLSIGRVSRLVLLHGVVHQAQLVGLITPQAPPGEDQLLGHGEANGPRQTLAAPCRPHSTGSRMTQITADRKDQSG